jgi:hypothetical protein
VIERPTTQRDIERAALEWTEARRSRDAAEFPLARGVAA